MKKEFSISNDKVLLNFSAKYIESVDRVNHIIYLKDGEICHMSVRLGKKIW